MIVTILLLVLFALFASLMFLRKLPALLALPLMALGIGFLEIAFGRLTLGDVALVIVADGAVRLYEPMVISMFGGILSLLLQKSGVAESIVRRGAELAGDNPWAVSVMLMAIVALLFTTIGGLGAVIMIGTIVLPILASIGVGEVISAGILLFGISLGGMLNANNWAIYKSVLSLGDEIVSSYALALFGAVALGALAFVTIELLRSGTVRLRAVVKSLGWTVLAAAAGAALLAAGTGVTLPEGLLQWVTGAVILVGVARSVAEYATGKVPEGRVRWYAYLATVVPLLLILVFHIPFVAAFLCGVAYGFLTTLRRGSLNMLSRSVIEGSQSVIPAVVLMIGIGMLISAILGPTMSGPAHAWYAPQLTAGADPPAEGGGTPALRFWPVSADMRPLMEAIVPQSGAWYVLLFALLGPLALYRGPLNVWGLGYGIGGVLLATGVPPGAIMGILMSMGVIQGVCDPTNTQNVWVANEMRVGVNEILWRTLPYAWAVALAGLTLSALRFYG